MGEYIFYFSPVDFKGTNYPLMIPCKSNGVCHQKIISIIPKFEELRFEQQKKYLDCGYHSMHLQHLIISPLVWTTQCKIKLNHHLNISIPFVWTPQCLIYSTNHNKNINPSHQKKVKCNKNNLKVLGVNGPYGFNFTT